MVEVQKEVFSIEEITSEVKALGSHIGAVVSFIGYVRDFDVSENKMLLEMRLEHYPGMTEKVLQTIEKKAFSKWDLSAVRIVHRVGILKLNDPIVAVVVASPHRNNAFDACRFIIDFLKTEAPFWKKEVTNKGAYWVEDKKSDLKQSMSWKKEG